MPRHVLTAEDRRKGGLARGAQQQAASLQAKTAQFKTTFDPADFTTTRGRSKKGNRYVTTEYAILIKPAGGKGYRVRQGSIRYYGNDDRGVLKAILAKQKTLSSSEMKVVSFRSPFTGESVVSER